MAKSPKFRKTRRWTSRKAVIGCSLLPLLVHTSALRIPTSCLRIRNVDLTRRCAVQVEEDVSLSEQESLHGEVEHFAFGTVASVKISSVDNLHHRNGNAQTNGKRLPLHAVAYEYPIANGKQVKSTTSPQQHHPVQQNRVVNGVPVPPYYNGAPVNGSSPGVLNGTPAETTGAHQPAVVDGSRQPILEVVNGAPQPPDFNGKQSTPTEPKNDTNTSASLDVNDDESDTQQSVEDAEPLIDEEEESNFPTVRKLWKRRHARSIEEGVRCEKTREKTTQLYRILSKTPIGPPKRAFFARTISGLINALAEEADGLEVSVEAQEDSPLWRKKVDAIHINFSRLGFKPLRMGGLDEAIRSLEFEIPSRVDQLAKDLELAAVSSADEAFDRIDEDNSGALDQDEIAKALNMAASSDSDKKLFEGLASQLVELYDFNGDGVVDREEYENLVADMATLRQAEKQRLKKQEEDEPWSGIKGVFEKFSRWIRRHETIFEEDPVDVVELGCESENDTVVKDEFVDISDEGTSPVVHIGELEESSPSADAEEASATKKGGSIVFEDLKLDLRQLVFGMLPVIKKITPGGPLVLEPFTATISGSFTTEDIKASRLLDMGLRRLVARALRLRVRGFRDLLDGAVFYGRKWNMASKSAPMVEVPELTSVEFDDENRMIITGRAQVRTSPTAPFIENSFKVRTKGIGTGKNGQCIRLEEPELALVLECPKQFEQALKLFAGSTGLPVPARPKPLYSFFPIYSPFRVVEDDDGFDMGEDNRIKSIEIRDGALQFELSAVLRPGRFLGNHYLAFTLPMRTFIITMARVREGIRTARRNKRAAEAKAKLLKDSERKDKARSYLDVVAQSLSSQELVADREKFRFADTRRDKKVVVVPQPPTNGSKSFFSRFVDGYLGARQDNDQQKQHQRLTSAISDWFGRQSSKNITAEEPLARRRQEV